MWHRLPAPSEIVFPFFSVCVTQKCEATATNKLTTLFSGYQPRQWWTKNFFLHLLFPTHHTDPDIEDSRGLQNAGFLPIIWPGKSNM
jgi:hypothetical protein